MSTVKANNVQVGQSGTATNNFTLYQPSTPDGTVRLAVGNSGATTGDVLSVSSTGLSVTGTLTSTGVNTFPAGSASAPSITTTGDTNTGVYFPGADSVAITTGGTAAVTVDSGQRTKFPTTIGIGNATPSTSGCGITFPASENLSTNGNTLDDYEEGTWTPTVTGGTTAGTTTYLNQAGRYNKVGNMVTVIAKVDYSAATGTGDLKIGGLPFSTYTDSGSLRYPGVLWTGDLNWTAGTYVTVWTGGTASTTLEILGALDDGAPASPQQMVNEAAGFAFSMTYRTS